MSIISISGKLSSGKDEVAKIIQYLDYLQSQPDDKDLSYERFKKVSNRYSSNWEIKRFADKIKDTICLWLGCTREQLEDRKFKERPLGEEWDKYKVQIDSAHRSEYFSTQREAEEHEKSIDYPNSQIVKVTMTPRKLMQLLGTECGREIIHPDLWCNALFSDYKEPKMNIDIDDVPEGMSYRDPALERMAKEGKIPYEMKPQQKWIIPDTRFPNEIKRIDKYNGLKIRLERDRWRRLGVERGETTPVSEKEMHPSEIALDDYEDWDYVIVNNGTINELVGSVKNIMKLEDYV